MTNATIHPTSEEISASWEPGSSPGKVLGLFLADLPPPFQSCSALLWQLLPSPKHPLCGMARILAGSSASTLNSSKTVFPICFSLSWFLSYLCATNIINYLLLFPCPKQYFSQNCGFGVMVLYVPKVHWINIELLKLELKVYLCIYKIILYTSSETATFLPNIALRY